VTRPEWGRAAAEAGADAVGLVFAESPRRVDPETAARIVRALPPWVAAVGVFVDAAADAVRAVAEEAGLAAAQLHGDEPPDTPGALEPLKVVKAFRIGSEADVEAALAWHRAAAEAGRPADAYLVDARVAGGPPGGTGRTADWALAARLRAACPAPVILAGGLGPENVAEAIRAVRPWGVDGSSGLETAPGRKDPERIRAFLAAVRRAEA
jgi:phosphoribosylanthranilate isomerase